MHFTSRTNGPERARFTQPRAMPLLLQASPGYPDPKGRLTIAQRFIAGSLAALVLVVAWAGDGFAQQPGGGLETFQKAPQIKPNDSTPGTVGDQLPSIRELARDLNVNPTTIVKAYGELRFEGVLEMRHGKGVFIAESSGKMTDDEKKKTLGRLARQILVEAKQMGAPFEMVKSVLENEKAEIDKEKTNV